MAQDFSFNMSQPFTPNATIDPTSTPDVSISFLSATSGENKTAQEICTSPDSCMFYTPEGSSHNSDVFIVPPSPLTNGDIECSDVGSNYQQEKQNNDPLFSTNKTEFICNLNAPNSRSKIGASPTQIRKVTPLSIPHAHISKDNKIACLPISPMIPAKYRKNLARNIPTHHLQNTANKPNSSLQKQDTILPSNSNGTVLCKSPQLAKKELLPNQKFLKPIQPSPFSKKKKFISSPRISRPKVYKCQHCSNTYTHTIQYEAHLLRHSKNMLLLLCNICGLTFNTKHFYKIHFYKHGELNATRKSTRKSVLSDGTMNNFPQTSSNFNDTKRIIPDHNIPPININVTPVHSSTNISMKQIAVSSLRNSPITSTPFSIKLNTKPKSQAKQRSEKNSKDHFSIQDLPEIGFKDEQTISLPNNTNLAEPIFPCDQCTKSYLSLRALRIHLCAHRKAGQFHDITKKPQRKLRNVFN